MRLDVQSQGIYGTPGSEPLERRTPGSAGPGSCTYTPPPGLGPLFAAIACTVCDTQTDLLSLTEMIEWGWSFAWTPLGHT